MAMNSHINWDKDAETWHNQAESMWETGSRKSILPFIDSYIHKNNTVLDAGCGSGYSSFLLSKLECIVKGIDLSSTMITLANTHYHNNNLTYEVADICHTPFSDCTFDVILYINSIEWTKKPLLTIYEMNRLLKKNGKVCISLLGPTAFPRTNSYERLYDKDVSCNTMMPWELEQLMLEHDFVMIKEQGIYGNIPQDFLQQLPKKHQQALAFSWLFLFELQQ